MPRLAPLLVIAALGAGPAAAQDAPSQEAPAREGTGQERAPAPRAIRNAPSARAMTLASYIYAASNVCGYRIGTAEFTALMAGQNVAAADLGPHGPVAGRINGMFTMMSNQMAQNREQACLAVAGEYGPEGSLARNVLQPADDTASPAPAAKP